MSEEAQKLSVSPLCQLNCFRICFSGLHQNKQMIIRTLTGPSNGMAVVPLSYIAPDSTEEGSGGQVDGTFRKQNINFFFLGHYCSRILSSASRFFRMRSSQLASLRDGGSQRAAAKETITATKNIPTSQIAANEATQSNSPPASLTIYSSHTNYCLYASLTVYSS